MYDNARIAVDELGLDLEVEFIHDITKALQYEVLQMPALIIDEKAVSFGRDLSVDDYFFPRIFLFGAEPTEQRI